MTLQVLKTSVEMFGDIQSGRKMAVIVKNDRIWSTYDELLFAECDASKNFTGRFVRLGVNSMRMGDLFGLQPAHQLIYLKALDRSPPVIEIENASIADLELAMKKTEANLRAPDVIKQGLVD